MSIPLRPRSTSEIVDAAFQLLRQHYAQFVTLMAMGYVPLLVIQMVFARVGFGFAGVGAGIGAVVGFFFAMLWYTLVDAVLILAVSDAYLGRPIDVAASFRTALSRFLSVIGAGIIKSFLVGLGLLLLLVPGFYFLAKYFAIPATVVIEGRGASDGASRSSDLSEGLKGHILKTVLLVFGIYFLLNIAGGAVMGVFLAGSRSPATAQLAGQIVSAVISILVYPIVSSVMTLLYYDARIRKEGYDLELMASDLGGARATG